MHHFNSYNLGVNGVHPKLGIVGCGAIGGEIARAVDAGKLEFKLAALCDINDNRAVSLASSLKASKPDVTDLNELAQICDVVFEAAHPDAVPSVVMACKGLDRQIVLMSVGGIPLLSPDDYADFAKSNSKIYLPSGAMGGVDAILAMREAGIKSIALTTTKPPNALGRNDVVRTVIFEGDAERAVREYPKNINIAMTARLAAGFDVPFTVKIVSDPSASGNTHSFEVDSYAGKAMMTFENLPHPERAGTSFIAPMSAIALLRKISESFSVGT